MKKLIASLVLLISAANCSSCGEPNQKILCTSRCGGNYMGQTGTGLQPEGWGCEDFQNAEDIALKKFSEIVTDARFEMNNMCRSINGYQFLTNPEFHWVDRWGRDIAGSTSCMYMTVEANNSPIWLGSYYHELAHVIQGCYAPSPNDKGEDSDHSNWVRDHIYRAIDNMND
jgi:hypothetical protein